MATRARSGDGRRAARGAKAATIRGAEERTATAQRDVIPAATMVDIKNSVAGYLAPARVRSDRDVPAPPSGQTLLSSLRPGREDFFDRARTPSPEREAIAGGYLSDGFSASALNGYARSYTTADPSSPPRAAESPPRGMSQKEFAKVVDRLYQTQKAYDDRRTRRLEDQRAAEMSEVQAKPVINRRSQELAETVEPLTQRSAKLNEDREARLRQAREEKDEQEKEKVSGHPALAPRSQAMVQRRTVQDMEAWNTARMAKRAELQAQKSREETYSFRPQVNAKSTKIFSTMRRTDEPMWDRMLREHGEKKAKRALEKELGADARDQFYPSISQRARRVKREGRVYDRLYATTRTSSRAKREAEDVQVEVAHRTGARVRTPSAEPRFAPPPRRDAAPASPAPRTPHEGAVNVVLYDPQFDHIFNHVRDSA